VEEIEQETEKLAIKSESLQRLLPDKTFHMKAKKERASQLKEQILDR